MTFFTTLIFNQYTFYTIIDVFDRIPLPGLQTFVWSSRSWSDPATGIDVRSWIPSSPIFVLTFWRSQDSSSSWTANILKTQKKLKRLTIQKNKKKKTFFWCALFGYLYFCYFWVCLLLTSIQYMGPGIEPLTAWLWAVYHSYSPKGEQVYFLLFL